jgi:hypothetical protein
MLCYISSASCHVGSPFHFMPPFVLILCQWCGALWGPSISFLMFVLLNPHYPSVPWGGRDETRHKGQGWNAEPNHDRCVCRKLRRQCRRCSIVLVLPPKLRRLLVLKTRWCACRRPYRRCRRCRRWTVVLVLPSKTQETFGAENKIL